MSEPTEPEQARNREILEYRSRKGPPGSPRELSSRRCPCQYRELGTAGEGVGFQPPPVAGDTWHRDHQPIFQAGKLWQESKRPYFDFFVVDGDVQRTSGIPCIPGGCVWMDGSQLVELRAHVPSRNALFPGCSILCGLYPNLQILTLVFLVGFH